MSAVRERGASDEERQAGAGACPASRFDGRQTSEAHACVAHPEVHDIQWCQQCAALKQRGVLDEKLHVPACVVAQHCEAGACYITAAKWVFDVTPFLPLHPGGEKAILRKAECGE